MASGLHSQTTHLNIEGFQPEMAYENVHIHQLDEDSLASTFIIWVKNGVAEHYHAEHTEVVYVIEGRGTMTLGRSTLELQPGDYIFIPKATPHSVEVTSEVPMKVISIQTPYFDGTDRHLVSQE